MKFFGKAFLPHFVALNFATLLFLSNAPEVFAAEPRLVFAHYMVCCSQNGHEASVEKLAQEIASAKQYGIDGFALNVGAWSKEPMYIEKSRRIFAAAASVDPNFKLFFSLDNLSLADSVAAIKEFSHSKSYWRVDGRPVVSSFGGTEEWTSQIKPMLQEEGISIYLIPYTYYPINDLAASVSPGGGDLYTVKSVLRRVPSLDGYFYFGAARLATSLPLAIRSITAALRTSGKTSMIGITPYYKGFGPYNARVFESNGFESMQNQWEAAIQSEADWVELVTWNDWGEATYLAPFGSPSDQNVLNYRWGPLLNHDAFLKASRYYIDWFKSGRSPEITKDAVYYFYRLHPKTSSATINNRTKELGRPVGADDLNDKIFLTAFSKEPGELSVEIGGALRTFSLPAGVSTVTVPLSQGQITLKLRRGAALIGSKKLEFPFTDDASVGVFKLFQRKFVALMGLST